MQSNMINLMKTFSIKNENLKQSIKYNIIKIFIKINYSYLLMYIDLKNLKDFLCGLKLDLCFVK